MEPLQNALIGILEYQKSEFPDNADNYDDLIADVKSGDTSSAPIVLGSGGKCGTYVNGVFIPCS